MRYLNLTVIRELCCRSGSTGRRSGHPWVVLDVRLATRVDTNSSERIYSCCSHSSLISPLASCFGALIGVIVAPPTAKGALRKTKGHPLNTGPVPRTAKALDSCSTLGKMACSVWSLFSGDAATKRRSACSAFIESNGTRIESCGSLLRCHN
jgi:hypothetical protein